MWQGASGSPKQGRPEMRGKLQRPTSFNPPHTQALPQQYSTSTRHTIDRNRKLGLVNYGSNHGRTKPQQRHKSGYSGVRQQPVLPQVKLPELVPSTTCTEHTFLTDASEVRHMEEGLTQLLTDFHNGKLRAFSDDTCSFQKMENIRDLQEKLSRLHFDMDSKMQEHEFGSENARQAASQSMDHLLSNLNQLSMAVHSMQPHDD